MKCLEVIPVIDVLGGKVVHAVAGDRSRYAPLTESVLTSSSDPHVLLERLAEKGFRKVYIADLDAIMHEEVTVDGLIAHAQKLGLSVLVDIGRRGLERVDSEKVRYVLGTEYLRLSEIEKVTGRVASLDLDGENARTLNGHVHYGEIVELLARCRPSLLIILRLDLVGTGRGLDTLTLRIIRYVKSVMPDVEVLYGGGVRGLEDLRLLVEEGVRGVLIATAIHRGLVNSCKVCF